jgi:hypothetical protein
MDTNDRILSEISRLEQEENVRVIHAIESGSRAWGFASPDSDFDVRFIYIRKPEYYLKLEKTRDVIEWALDEVLDINGWDLQKTLRLLHNSNPTLFEWSNSPIIYKTTSFWTNVKQEINDWFLTKAGVYHYLSTAKSNYREYLRGDMVKLKKYFYVIRPILACKWILSHNCPPPMLFSELVESELEADMRPIIYDLLELKSKTPEVGEGKRIDELNAYIEKNLEQLKEIADSLPRDNKKDWERLNEIFLTALKQEG